MNFLKHLFLPRFSNNQRAHLIHNQNIFFVALLLIGASFFITAAKNHISGVLGVSVNVAAQDLLALTNQDRANAGLQPLQMNQELSFAAEAKAQDMFAKDYWAHYAPDGKSPWDFIKAAGYNYVYAGENLARGFTSSPDVVNAWMASPEHRANMLSNNYTDVGFAIEQGRLPGDDNTVLVVEMFGSRSLGTATSKQPPVVVAQVTATPVESSPSGQQVVQKTTPIPTLVPVLSAVKKTTLIDSAFLTKTISLALLSLFVLIFGMDVVVTENRKTVRLAGHSFDHLLFLIGILIIAISLGLGVVR
ncbi:MAG TPA: CAP domain-containing protein [Patescibacteria group bacterium]|nr:CAP domain-containing protein [Patescibacteria group bacterium]